jgi:hypothetical protein
VAVLLRVKIRRKRYVKVSLLQKARMNNPLPSFSFDTGEHALSIGNIDNCNKFAYANSLIGGIESNSQLDLPQTIKAKPILA